MKDYPSIPRGHIVKGVPIYAFDKLDGTQIRAEWTRKRGGLWKFGTKSHLIDEGDGLWGEVVRLVRTKYDGDLDEVFRRERWQKAVAFFEF